MKKLIPFCFLALVICLLPASRPAEARSFVSLLATVPDSIFHVVTVGTDTAEYVASKVNYGFMEIDTVADDAVLYFHNVAHPTSAAQVAKAQAKQAKKQAAKAAKQAK
jgi:hypothetical protein